MWFIIAILLLLLFCIWQCRQFNWRPIAGASAGETRTKRWLEERFGVPFDKIRPDWLRNPKTGKNLEIDCFNGDLGLGVEYNGEQHYMIVDKFGGTPESLAYSQYKDQLKGELCRANGIHLITVPYWERDIERFLAQETTLWELARGSNMPSSV